MARSFFFYDLETSGFNPRSDRIMQFGGQRTDSKLQPIGDPVNLLIKMTPDTVPSPDAVLVTGITPQKTLSEGISEAEFVKYFLDEIVQPETIFVGFNTVRFDDEFMRFLLYRNYADAYEWQWKNGCSRWDLLDVVRMTRALRPQGIKWPVDSEGKPGNRLEMLTQLNNIAHKGAHDALSDVKATIALAQLIHKEQPKLFDFLLKMRDKKQVNNLVHQGQPFVYTSGKYPAGFEKTTLVMTLSDHPKKQGVLVYDLRHKPDSYLKMTPEELVEKWRYKPDSEEPRLPVKTLQFNRCPAIAPIGVLDTKSTKRLKLDVKEAMENREVIIKNRSLFNKNLARALDILDKQQQTRLLGDETTVDEQLYEGFFRDHDKKVMEQMRVSKPDNLEKTGKDFIDTRLKQLMPLYKARNFAKSLNAEERIIWDNYVKKRLQRAIQPFFKRLDELAQDSKLSKQKQYLLEELRLYGESLLPADVG